MMPNYKDLKPTEVIGRIVAHEMSLKDKEELHNKSSGAYKASCDAPTSSSAKQTFNSSLKTCFSLDVAGASHEAL